MNHKKILTAQLAWVDQPPVLADHFAMSPVPNGDFVQVIQVNCTKTQGQRSSMRMGSKYFKGGPNTSVVYGPGYSKSRAPRLA